MTLLQDRVVLISGGTQGLGRPGRRSDGKLAAAATRSARRRGLRRGPLGRGHRFGVDWDQNVLGGFDYRAPSWPRQPCLAR